MSQEIQLADIASKQKKLRTIRLVMKDSLVSSKIKAKAEEVLLSYQNLLLKVWEKQDVSPEDAAAIVNSERELDGIHESLRLLAKPAE